MKKLSLVLTLSLCAACTPALRIAPGQLPAAELPSAQLKSEAESYVHQHADEEDFREINSGPDLARITKMVNRLAVAAGYPSRTFPVHLMDAGEEVNAAAFNGASVVVYAELLKRVPSDPQLATVVGHEMGHILAKHYAEQQEQEGRAAAVSVGSSLLGSIASVATSLAGYGGAADIAGSVTETSTGMIGYGAFVGSFSRRQEYEADHLGLLIMAKAGYDPRQALVFWKRAEEVFGGTSSGIGSFFNTHPAEGDRLQEIEAALPLAMKLYAPD